MQVAGTAASMKDWALRSAIDLLVRGEQDVRATHLGKLYIQQHGHTPECVIPAPAHPSSATRCSISAARLQWLTAPPTAKVICTTGTPMTARVTKGSALTNPLIALNMPGLPGSSQNVGTPNTLPVGMVMGIVSFAGFAGAVGVPGTTYGSALPSVSATANGSEQDLVLSAGVYSNSIVPLNGTYAGKWYFPFNVSLDF